MIPLILALTGQLSDCLTTQLSISNGARELNPLMAPIIAYPILFYGLKISIALYSAYADKRLALFCAFMGFSAAVWNLL